MDNREERIERNLDSIATDLLSAIRLGDRNEPRFKMKKSNVFNRHSKMAEATHLKFGRVINNYVCNKCTHFG